MTNPNPSPVCPACDGTKVVSQGGHDTGCDACFALSQTLPAPGEVERGCPASPDHADIKETIEDAADDWQAKGYTSALAEVRDMAAVGRSLMEALPTGYCYMDSPAEIVSDLQNELDEALATVAAANDEGDWVNHERIRQEAYASGYRQAIDDAAMVADDLNFGTEIGEWLAMTKKDVSARACHECAAAIRLLSQGGGKS
jgi:hypothetical protein